MSAVGVSMSVVHPLAWNLTCGCDSAPHSLGSVPSPAGSGAPRKPQLSRWGSASLFTCSTSLSAPPPPSSVCKASLLSLQRWAWTRGGVLPRGLALDRLSSLMFGCSCQTLAALEAVSR